MIVNLIKLSRPRQWIKNFFVFAPLLFSKHLFEAGYVIKAFEAFVVFCFASSSVYVVNDILDAESDRAHPKKKYRPIASGEISIRQAIVFLVVIFIIIAALLYMQRPEVTGIIILYITANLLYSLYIKSIVLLDVFFISFGFMVRVLGGAFAISVSLSSWMVLCTIFISLFLAISKRRAELSQSTASGANPEAIQKQRRVLKDYSVEFADELNTIAAAGTIISYALYTVSERTVQIFGTGKLIYTTPFVIYGIFRYMYLIHKKNLGESPSTIVAKDIPIMINVLLWFLCCIVIIYRLEIPLISPALRVFFP
jgi:4-hydroxybenzoate polyprenyltransferase